MNSQSDFITAWFSSIPLLTAMDATPVFTSGGADWCESVTFAGAISMHCRLATRAISDHFERSRSLQRIAEK
jgi:hypothetical protein